FWWFAHSMPRPEAVYTQPGQKKRSGAGGPAPEKLSGFLPDGLLEAVFFRQLVDLLLQFLDHFLLGNFPDDLAVPEQQALSPGAGDSDIRLLRLAGAVDGAPEHRNLDRRLDVGQVFFDFVGDADQIDFDASAGRTGDQGGGVG